MSQVASSIIIVFHTLTLIGCLVNIGIGVFVWIASNSLHIIGIWVYCVIVFAYMITYFALCRRDVGFVSAKADVIMLTILAILGIVAAAFVTWVAVFPTITLGLAVIFEGVFVGRTPLEGKWNMSLYRICTKLDGTESVERVGYKVPDLEAPRLAPYDTNQQAPPYNPHADGTGIYPPAGQNSYLASSSQGTYSEYDQNNYLSQGDVEAATPQPNLPRGKFGAPSNTNRPPSMEAPPPAYQNP